MGIDPDIAIWLLDFLLRQSLEDQTLKSLLRALPLPNGNLNLQKLFLLKKLEFDISRNFVSVATLELLEQLEETEFLQGNETVSDTMKEAYCAVAVECTVKNLKAGDVDDKGKRFNFFEEVKTVWKGKIAKLKKNMEKGGLGSEALWVWQDEIEAALWDDEVFESIVMKSEGVHGVEAVNAYIREEREKMGPSFLELVAERAKSDEVLQGILGIHGIDPAAGKEASPSCVNTVAGGSNATKDGIDLGAGKEAPPSFVNVVADGSSASKGAGKETPPSFVNVVADGSSASKDGIDLSAGKEAPAPPSCVNVVANGSSASKHGIDLGAGKEAPPSCVNVVADGSSASKQINKGKIKLREKHLALRRTRGLTSRNSRGAKIVDHDETTNEKPFNKYKLPCSAEVHKTRESLALSSLDLQEVVKDPLPDALKLAQAISREARNNNPQSPVEDNHASTAGVARAPCGNTSNAPGPSLFERNDTAHAFEWDESIDGSQEYQACVARLPSPTRINTSPLNQYQIVNLNKRRRNRKWTLQEEDALRTAVNKCGLGRWKLILNLNRDTFEGRTEVDLKDKWRNMMGR